ncbi:unnamed protein product [Heligmosomoides polygyrus]|uniref:ULP_PROTEASE domain-containing protein n=1 Tax=Heligmosomoides polygyrus TaxID=6339 RepID=A0A183FQJ5_HELPZ|nr:unnamed protein product [Heligmosomoides polygyrus]
MPRLRLCTVCIERFDSRLVRKSWATKNTDAILISCLTKYGYPGTRNPGGTYNMWLMFKSWICHKHFVQAGRLILAEMRMLDLHYDKPIMLSFQNQVYPDNIPARVVDFINGVVKDIDGKLIINRKDVWKFLKLVVFRYYGTVFWNVVETPEQIRELNAADMLGTGDEAENGEESMDRGLAVQDNLEPVAKRSRTSTSSPECVVIDDSDHFTDQDDEDEDEDDDDEPLFTDIKSDPASPSLLHVLVAESNPDVVEMQGQAVEHQQSTSSGGTLGPPPRPARHLTSISGTIRSIICMRSGLNPVGDSNRAGTAIGGVDAATFASGDDPYRDAKDKTELTSFDLTRELKDPNVAVQDVGEPVETSAPSPDCVTIDDSDHSTSSVSDDEPLFSTSPAQHLMNIDVKTDPTLSPPLFTSVERPEPAPLAVQCSSSESSQNVAHNDRLPSSSSTAQSPDRYLATVNGLRRKVQSLQWHLKPAEEADHSGAVNFTAMERSRIGPMEGMSSAHLRRFYLVNGVQLMKLFRFCPECGRGLHEKELTPAGSGAVVRFRCECSSPTIWGWESRERTG